MWRSLLTTSDALCRGKRAWEIYQSKRTSRTGTTRLEHEVGVVDDDGMLHPNTRHTYSNNLGDSHVITFKLMSILYLTKASVRLISAWVQALPQTNDADRWERRRGRLVSQCLSGGEAQACAHF